MESQLIDSVKEKISDNSSDNNNSHVDNNNHKNSHKVLTGKICPTSDSSVCNSQSVLKSSDHLTETVTNNINDLATSDFAAIVSDTMVSAESSAETAAVSIESDRVLQSATETSLTLSSTVAIDSPCKAYKVSSDQSQISSENHLSQPFPDEVGFCLFS